VDGIDGPRKSMRPVARRKPGFPCVQETNNVLVEVTITANQRDANYVHHGWSHAVASAIPPWTLSRMTSDNLGTFNPVAEEWVTKQSTLQRLSFDLLVEELEPIPDFEAEVQSALAKPTKFEKFQALYRVLHRW
jgi:hypothetical protein